MSESEGLLDVIDQLSDKAHEDGDLSVQEALDAFAGRLFGPLLLIPGLAVVTPVGMIPTVPTIMGVFVILVAGQSLIGRDHPWLPGLVADRKVEADKFDEAMKKFRPWARWIDKFTAPRLRWMVKGPMKYVIASICVVLACSLPPLELLPWACFVPGVAILMLGLAITAEDGLLAILGVAASVGAISLLFWAIPKVTEFLSG